jgi:hypothetical protein
MGVVAALGWFAVEAHADRSIAIAVTVRLGLRFISIHLGASRETSEQEICSPTKCGKLLTELWGSTVCQTFAEFILLITEQT